MSESDVYRRQIMTSKVGPRAKRVKDHRFLPELRTNIPVAVPAPARRWLEVVFRELHFAGGIGEFRTGHGRPSSGPVTNDGYLIFILQ